MPARIVAVFDVPDLADQTAAELRAAGYDAATLPDSMVALDALEGAARIELLVTSPEHGEGKPNGIALARMARIKRPGIKVLFVGQLEYARYAAGLGEFVATPVAVAEVVSTAIRILAD